MKLNSCCQRKYHFPIKPMISTEKNPLSTKNIRFSLKITAATENIFRLWEYTLPLFFINIFLVAKLPFHRSHPLSWEPSFATKKQRHLHLKWHFHCWRYSAMDRAFTKQSQRDSAREPTSYFPSSTADFPSNSFCSSKSDTPNNSFSRSTHNSEDCSESTEGFLHSTPNNNAAHNNTTTHDHSHLINANNNNSCNGHFVNRAYQGSSHSIPGNATSTLNNNNGSNSHNNSHVMNNSYTNGVSRSPQTFTRLAGPYHSPDIATYHYAFYWPKKQNYVTIILSQPSFFFFSFPNTPMPSKPAKWNKKKRHQHLMVVGTFSLICVHLKWARA